MFVKIRFCSLKVSITTPMKRFKKRMQLQNIMKRVKGTKVYGELFSIGAESISVASTEDHMTLIHPS